MRLSPQGKELFIAASRDLGLDLTGRFELFDQLFDLLTENNQKMNLTGLTSEPEIILKHFIDSLSCLRSNRLEGALRVIDLGTGAGFPGLPLCIARPQLEVVLMDATRKKIGFVEKVLEALALPNAYTLWGRAEDLGHQTAHREGYDRVVTRAVSTLSTLYELCLPLLRVGGYLIAQKGAEAQSEVVASGTALEKLGGKLVESVWFELPVIGDSRCLVIVEKTSPTPTKYPRRPGMPEKNPLS